MTTPEPGTTDERIPDERPKPTFLWALLSGWLLGLEAWLRSHGGRRLQYSIRGFWAFIGVGGLVLMFGPVINPPPTLEDITGSASTATEQWIARDFTVDYTISRDSDGALRADVVEQIDAFFPADADDRGIQRTLPTEYQGNSLAPSDVSATFNGEPIDVATSSTADRLTLSLLGDAELDGDHEYVLRYTLHHLAYETTDEASGRPTDLLEWDAFGPAWGQASAALDVRVTLPDELDDRLVRQPRGVVAWTLLGAGAWLEKEADSAPGQVTYRFTNGQTLPPHSQAYFTMAFEPGTFTMPPRSTLWWVQTFGPLAPLAFLGITLLLALAARAVAWGDARGRPWFVAQYEPPRDVSPRMAAHILRQPAAFELAGALERIRTPRRKGLLRNREDPLRDRRIAAARVARRTGRLGDRPRALSLYLAATERRHQLASKLRRIPRGFVHDAFIAAPVALTLVQWGLVRQLSHQATLAVVWWPVAFVIASTVIAAVILAIALTARPLTRRGALLKQHLLGIGVYAERTQMLDRTVSNDPLLPYAVLMAPPRTAGRQVVALIERELDEPGISSRWHTSDFITWPRLLLRPLSALIVIAAIAMVQFAPNAYHHRPEPAMYSWDLPGTTLVKVQSMRATAELSRSDSGHARLEVRERLDVTFDGKASRVPQFAQQWPSRVDGHDLGLTVDRVLIDGDAVAYDVAPDGETLLMTTRLAQVLDGDHEVQVHYTIASAAVAADAAGEGLVDRVTWSALLEGWKHRSHWGSDPPIEPLLLELRLSEDLAGQAVAAGWLTVDVDAGDSPQEWIDTVVPFGTVGSLLRPPLDDVAEEDLGQGEGVTTETSEVRGGVRTHTLDLRQDQFGGYPWELAVDDLGVALDFERGTFAGPDEGALRAAQAWEAAPFTVTLALGAAATLVGAIGSILGRQRSPSMNRPGFARDAVRWFGPAATLATVILFMWTTADMSEDHSLFPPLALVTVAAIGTCIASLVLTRRRRTAG